MTVTFCHPSFLPGALCAFLLIWGTASLIPFVQRRPQCRSRTTAADFPLFASNVQILQANDYSVSSSSSPTGSISLWDELLERFQGDFDNYRQVVQDREKGLLPREGGGHEHIHCCIVPVTSNTRLAAFYFDGMPGAIFRFRYYKLVKHNETAVDTVLYTLNTELEAQLRRTSDPGRWPDIFHSFQNSLERQLTTNQTEAAATKLLPRCDVRWSFTRDPVQHAYVETEAHRADDDAIHAVMVYGPATLESQMLPGQQILVKDQLSLWRNEFWIHDRGYNPDTMSFIYGNQRGVPYAMERVTQWRSPTDTSSRRRRVVRSDLIWTLGPDHRSEQVYEQRMAAIGGASAAVPKRRRGTKRHDAKSRT